jgi:3-oxoacyl-[acyl-carrier-protein] synthase III
MTYRLVPKTFRVLGSGAALPGPALSTDELLEKTKALGVTNARLGRALATRLGIQFRHISRDFHEAMESPRKGHGNPDLCAEALRGALAEALVPPNDLAYLLGHTTTPHTLLPPNISWAADILGYEGPYAELRQACTGFANALQLAVGMLADAGSPPVAIVGSETGSLFFDPRTADENADQLLNLVQMGDGAGAIVLGHDDGRPGARIESPYFGTIGLRKSPGFALRAGGSGEPFAREGGVFTFEHDFGHVRSLGPDLFAQGIAAVRRAGVDVERIDWYLPHQANARIGELLGPELGLPPEKFIVDADRVGNLGSASIWVALHRLRASGRLRDGETVLVLGAEATKFLYGGFVYRHGSARG